MTRLVFLSLFAALPAALSAADDPTTILLVRHAERTSPTADSISESGRQRAQELKRMLADIPLHSIYVSEMKRTAETAAPIASARNLTPVATPAADIDALVAKLKSVPAGSSVLVVHHSNTLPKVVEKLGGSIPPISDTEFDRLIVVTVYPGKSKVLTLRYGAR
jgi:phosphohistidine phosphatase SixA